MNNIKNGNMPASPVKGCDGRFIDCTDDNMQWLKQCAPSVGLSKRETFAMAAMQGILANSEPNSWSEEQWYKRFSAQAVNHADALLAELEK